jgi:hypothetical protein
VEDGIRGTLKLQENFTDFVLLKSDGIPTYHFAHVCDDHFMRTTHVIRDESWLATLPIHVQLFDTLGWKRPLYCHTAQLMKMDGESKRKLSKRKDPELALSYYREAGVPQELSFYDAPVRAEWELSRPGEAAYGCVRIAPSEAFEVDYRLTSVDSAVSVAIYSAEDLFAEFMARTFITEKDYREARAAGLLAGVDETCGLLLPDGSANRNLYRVDEEPARHKVLDLLGDIAFVCPSLPKVRIEILNGGHVAHHQIVRRLLPYVALRNPSQVG